MFILHSGNKREKDIKMVEYFKTLMVKKDVLLEIDAFFGYIANKITNLSAREGLYWLAGLVGCCILYYCLILLKTSSKKIKITSLASLAAIAFFLYANGILYPLFGIILITLHIFLQITGTWLFKKIDLKLSQGKITILRLNYYFLFNWFIFAASMFCFLPKESNSIMDGFINFIILGIFGTFVISLFFLRKMIQRTIDDTKNIYLRRLWKILYASIWLFICLFVLMWISRDALIVRINKAIAGIFIFIAIQTIRGGIKILLSKKISMNKDKKSRIQPQTVKIYQLINFILKTVLTPFTFYLIFYIWGINLFSFVLEFISYNNVLKILQICVIIAITYLLWLFLPNIVRALVRPKNRHIQISKRFETFLFLINIIFKSFVLILALILSLYILNINMTPLFGHFWLLIAGLSLGLQSIMKDLSIGVIMMFEDAFHIGDNVIVAGVSGIVEEITLRVLKIRDFDGLLVSIPFNKIDIVSNKSRTFVVARFCVVVDSKANSDLVIDAMKDACTKLMESKEYADKILDEMVVLGPLSIAAGSAEYEARLKIKPMNMNIIKGDFFQICKINFEKAGIVLGNDYSALKNLF